MLSLLFLLAQDLPRELVEGLRSPEIVQREKAAAGLCAMGSRALPGLGALAEDADPEVRAVAASIAGQIRIAAVLTPALQRALPGLPARLATGGDEAWTDAFLDAVEVVWREENGSVHTELRHPGLGRRDLEPLVARALRGARNEKIEAVFVEVENRSLRAPAKDLAPFLRSEDPRLRARVVQALIGSADPEAVGFLRDRLSDPEGSVADRAAAGLALLGERILADRLERIIREEEAPGHSELHVLAARALDRMEARDRVAGLWELARTPDPELRVRALESIGILGSGADVGDLERLSKDEDLDVAGEARRALAAIGGDRAVDFLRADLKTNYALNAAFALGRLGDRRAIPDLLRVLEDPELVTRVNAARALGELGAVEALELLAALVKSKFALERHVACQARARLGAKEEIPNLLAQMKTGDFWERGYSAAQLCRMGERSGAALVVENGDELSCLNALRRPKAWGALEKVKPPAGSLRGTASQVLDALAMAAKLRVEAVPESRKELEVHFFHQGWLSRSAAAAELLADIESLLRGRLHFVLEEDRLRVLPCEEGHRFWEAWLAAK